MTVSGADLLLPAFEPVPALALDLVVGDPVVGSGRKGREAL
jgi:hypothetical protein